MEEICLAMMQGAARFPSGAVWTLEGGGGGGTQGPEIVVGVLGRFPRGGVIGSLWMSYLNIPTPGRPGVGWGVYMCEYTLEEFRG